MITSFVIVEDGELQAFLAEQLDLGNENDTVSIKVVNAHERYSAISLARTLLTNRPGKVAVVVGTDDDGTDADLLEIQQALADIADQDRFETFPFYVGGERAGLAAQLIEFLHPDLICNGCHVSEVTTRLWPKLNERRSDLIGKRFTQHLTRNEQRELVYLKQTADNLVSRIDMQLFEPAWRFHREASDLLTNRSA